MQYGYFDDANREYVITNPKTPVKWINYIGTLSFGGFVDHTGGILVCKGDPALNRITKYIPQLPSSNFKGSTIYIRIRDEGDEQKTHIYSPFFTPTLDPLDRFECRVGLGYTTWVTECYGIRTTVTTFIPLGAEQVVQTITVTNLREDTPEIAVIPTVEFTHFDALKQFTNADWIPQTMTCKAVDLGEAGDYTTLIQYPFMMRDVRHNFFTSNAPAASYETDRGRFLGDNEYGTWATPLSLSGTKSGTNGTHGSLSSQDAMRGDNIAALLHELGALGSNESRKIIVQLGQTDQVDKLPRLVKKYRDEANVQAALNDLAVFWEERLGRFQVTTPAPTMDNMINIHNARQTYITMNWSRYLSLYQLGLGARGIGFRDSSQDVMGIVGIAPDEGRDLIVKLLHTQKIDGSAMHQFNPMSMVATTGEAEDETRLPFYGDDHLWIVLATAEYLKETGDFALLDKIVPFYDKDESEQTLEEGTILEHLHRAVKFTWENVGAHGLPLLGFADWNDSVNLLPGAESLFNANLFGVALNELRDLCDLLGDVAHSARYEAWYTEMARRVNEYAWDGDWYIRYFDHDGTPVGSQTNEKGQIYTNGQSWPVMSGFADTERATRALDSVYERLNTPKGIKLSAPGYDGYEPDVGGVTTYPPGAKENGGIFLHSNPWVMIAETMLGRGDRAFDYYMQVNPAAKNDMIDEFQTEPYVYPQNILADEHPQFGLARNSWLTGTSSWMYQAGTKYILGIRPTLTGLMIDPCIPHHWDGYTVRRIYRNATYVIKVENPHHWSKGVGRITVDGTVIDGHILPVFDDGKVHQVVVTLGDQS